MERILFCSFYCLGVNMFEFKRCPFCGSSPVVFKIMDQKSGDDVCGGVSCSGDEINGLIGCPLERVIFDELYWEKRSDI